MNNIDCEHFNCPDCRKLCIICKNNNNNKNNKIKIVDMKPSDKEIGIKYGFNVKPEDDLEIKYIKE